MIASTLSFAQATDTVTLMPGSHVTITGPHGRILLDARVPAEIEAREIDAAYEAAERECQSDSDVRTKRPDVNKVWSLRTVLDDFHSRTRHKRGKASWDDYFRLVKFWEAYHDGPGPDVGSLTGPAIFAFFESRKEWGDARTWKKYGDLLMAMLKGVCPQSHRNRYGVQAEDAAFASPDDLPIWDIPDDGWFLHRTDTIERRGGHQQRDLPLLTLDEFSRVLAACCDCREYSPAFMQAKLLQLWIYPQRVKDSFRWRYSSEAKVPLRVDREQRTITYTESKKTNKTSVPLDSDLADVLRRCEARDIKPHDDDLVWPLSRTEFANLHRYWYPCYYAIWQRARVVARKPHEMRMDSISRWLKHNSDYSARIAAHSERGSIQRGTYQIKAVDAEFRDAVATFPRPPRDDWWLFD